MILRNNDIIALYAQMRLDACAAIVNNNYISKFGYTSACYRSIDLLFIY